MDTGVYQNNTQICVSGMSLDVTTFPKEYMGAWVFCHTIDAFSDDFFIGRIP